MTMYMFSGEESENRTMQFGNVRTGSFCKSLSPEALAEFGAIASYSSCIAGAELYGEEQIPAKVFILLQGQIKVSIGARNGRRLILRVVKPGEVLGLSSAFSGNFYEETAQAISPCNLISIRCSDFARFVIRHLTALQAIMRELGTQYEQACARLRVMGMALTVAAKLARLLLEWTATAQETEYGIRIHISLTHGEIGECIGTCRESVTRIFSDMQRRQIVNLRGSILTIMNRPALEDCARV
jgi:CRP/FNR family transcriptional regulator, cyclic AMP receptor protein